MRRRPKKNHGHEDNERWLITYSDMITLLLVFFIVLYSMSEVQQIKFNALVSSLKTAFEGQTILDNTNTPSGQVANLPPVPKKKDSAENEKKLDKLYVEMEKLIQENHLQDLVELVNIPRGVQITFKDKILFDTGSDAIKPEAKPILEKIGALLRPMSNDISVEGHTDNQPITSGRFPSNWELSGARARSVMYYLIDHDQIKPQRMSFVGFGQYKPRAKNDTPEHRQMNRRVNIIVLR